MLQTRQVDSGSTAAPARAEVPPPVRASFRLWVVAVGAGAFETVLAVGGMIADGSAEPGEIAFGLGLRLVVFATALAVASRMRNGARWARWALALGLGVLGTASMVADPIAFLADGGSPVTAFTGAGVQEWLFAASRAVHVTAVITAVVAMFLPSTAPWFRARTTGRADA